MNATRPDDTWNAGDPYEAYVGRWSRLVAHEFLAWLALPSSLRWLDVGCGTGSLTAAIAAQCAPAALTGVDPSAGFLDKARARMQGLADLRVANALDLPIADASADVVVSGLVLNFVPDTGRGLAEMRRVVVPGGTIAAYVWDYAGKMELMRHFWDAAERSTQRAGSRRGRSVSVVRPRCAGDRIPWRRTRCCGGRSHRRAHALRRLRRLLESLPRGTGPGAVVRDVARRAARIRLREHLRARLPAEADGSIALVARAWAIRGRVPA